MTTNAPTSAAEATTMAHTPDPLPEVPGTPDAAAGARSRRWDLLGDKPLQTLLATVAVALLMFELTGTRNRIDRLEDTVAAGFASIDAKIDARFADQDAKIDARFADQDAKIDARFADQDAKFDELNLKLTALIAALNMTDEVGAALEGRLLDPESPAGPGSEPR